MSGPADLVVTGGRLFQAFKPGDLVPYGSDIGPRPVAAPNAIAVRDGMALDATLEVVASMQPYHADPSPNQIDVWAGNIGPERAGRAWSWASIRRAGGVIALGSDWPVVPFDPFIALNSAVNRQTVEGHPAGGWLPSEKLSLPEALAAYGHGSAYAAFADDRRGTLRAGADADLVVLDRDILAGGPSSIIGGTVALTVVGGQVVHRSEALP